MAISAAGWAVVALDLIKTATIIMENGENMTADEVDALVAATQTRARNTVDSIRQSLGPDDAEPTA